MLTLKHCQTSLFYADSNPYGKHINDHKVVVACSFSDEYVFYPIDIEGDFLVGLTVCCCCDGSAGRRQVWVGEVDVLEGVVTLHEEVHVDVGVVVQRLVALQACIRGRVQKARELSWDSLQMRHLQLVLTLPVLGGRAGFC
jgi:hypothetical protein